MWDHLSIGVLTVSTSPEVLRHELRELLHSMEWAFANGDGHHDRGHPAYAAIRAREAWLRARIAEAEALSP